MHAHVGNAADSKGTLALFVGNSVKLHLTSLITMIVSFSEVEVMTLLQQEKASEKSSLEKQIEDSQQSLNKKEKEILVLRGELQEVCD